MHITGMLAAPAVKNALQTHATYCLHTKHWQGTLYDY